MSRKGRRSRANRPNRANLTAESARPARSVALPRGQRESAARALDPAPSLVPAPDSSPSLVPAPDSSSVLAFALASDAPPGLDEPSPAFVPRFEPAPTFALDAGPDSAPALSFEAPLGSDRPPSLGPGEASVPPVVGDLDTPFDARFFEQTPSEFWLAQLELRDPRWLLKTTAAAARRRAHLARYVLGVVAVSAVLCLAALVRVAVPARDDDDRRPAARMGMPASDPATDLSRGPATGLAAVQPTADPAEPAKAGAPDAGPG